MEPFTKEDKVNTLVANCDKCKKGVGATNSVFWPKIREFRIRHSKCKVVIN